MSCYSPDCVYIVHPFLQKSKRFEAKRLFSTFLSKYINEDVLICSTASTDSNWMSQYGINGTFSAGADFELMVAAHEEAKKAGIPFHGGNIFAADVFYDVDPNIWKKWAALGVMGVEMESYALYVNAARFNKKALCLLTVTDSFINKDIHLTSEERAFGLGRMIELAIATAERFC